MPTPENTAPDYLDLPLGELLDRVASDSPAPGGGSVAAIAVALAAGLAGMAARLSTGQLPTPPSWQTRRMPPGAGSHPSPGPTQSPTGASSTLTAIPTPRRARRASGTPSRGPPTCRWPSPRSGARSPASRPGSLKRATRTCEGDALAAVLLAGAGVRAAAALVEINLSTANVDDDRLGRANSLVDTTAATVRRATEGDG